MNERRHTWVVEGVLNREEGATLSDAAGQPLYEIHVIRDVVNHTDHHRSVPSGRTLEHPFTSGVVDDRNAVVSGVNSLEMRGAGSTGLGDGDQRACLKESPSERAMPRADLHHLAGSTLLRGDPAHHPGQATLHHFAQPAMAQVR